MALINCPECKNMISEYAAFCVHCGYPLNPGNPQQPIEVVVHETHQVHQEVKSETQSLPMMLTLKEASKVSGLSYEGLRRLCIEGKLVHVRIGRKIFVNQDKMKEYLSKSK